MRPPAQAVPKLQSASKWKYLAGEENSIKLHVAVARGVDLLPESTCSRVFVWESTEAATLSAHNAASQARFALACKLNPHHGPGECTQMKTGHDQDIPNTPPSAYTVQEPDCIVHLRGCCPSCHHHHL